MDLLLFKDKQMECLQMHHLCSSQRWTDFFVYKASLCSFIKNLFHMLLNIHPKKFANFV